MSNAGDSTTVVSKDRRGANSRGGHTCLVTIHGPGLGQRYDLGDETSIGRGEDNDVVVPLEDVSRRHCRITRTASGGFVVSDLDSTNGTYRNDQQVPPGAAIPLEPGDLLNLGGVIYKVLDGSNVEVQYHEELYRTAIIDGLTQIHNRRYLTEFLETEMARAARYGRSVALVLFDVDHFKLINDDFGHPVGDHVLRELAACVASQIRRECCFARYGGEEFAIVMPETEIEDARIVAERVRGTVETHDFSADGRSIRVTVSVGVATMDPHMTGVAEFFHVVDGNLYEAKHQGRNRVVG
ncbi:MAG: diguanylate cyclase [Myxococcota bacterium]